MKIISVTFDYPGTHKYAVLAKVLEYSIKKNCPKATFELIKIPAPEVKSAKKCFDSNTVKIRKWLEALEATDEDVIFLDCDMVVLQDLHGVFTKQFDVALTAGGTGTIPYNGGAVFVRNTKAGKDFIRLWTQANDELYGNQTKHYKWRLKYAGMNQASLGYLLETMKFEAKVLDLPCEEWNLCKNNWPRINQNSKILHVKSGLRTAVFDEGGIVASQPAYRRAVMIWKTLAVEAGVIPDNGKIKVPVFTRVETRAVARVRKRHARGRWFEKRAE